MERERENGKKGTHQARRVEFLVARAARQLWDLVVGTVQDGVADVALLHALELFVQVSLPQHQTVPNRTILNYVQIRINYFKDNFRVPVALGK